MQAFSALLTCVAQTWREPEPTVYSHPHQLWSYPLLACTFEIHRIDVVEGQPIPQRAKRVLLCPEATAMVSWGYWDQNIRMCSVETGKVLLVIKTSHDDEILCADITKDGQFLVTGGTSSLIKVPLPLPLPFFAFLPETDVRSRYGS